MSSNTEWLDLDSMIQYGEDNEEEVAVSRSKSPTQLRIVSWRTSLTNPFSYIKQSPAYTSTLIRSVQRSQVSWCMHGYMAVVDKVDIDVAVDRETAGRRVLAGIAGAVCLLMLWM